MAKVLALICEETGGPDRANIETLAAAAAVAKAMGGGVCVAVAGADPKPRARELAVYPVERVVAVTLPVALRWEPDAWLDAFASVCVAEAPVVILMAGNPVGRELAPRLAWRLRAGLVTDCVDLRAAPDGGLVAVKPVYGGKALAEYRYQTPVQIATVRPRAYQPLQACAEATAPVAEVAPKLPGVGGVRARTQEYTDPGSVGLENARIVVSGGRGIGGPEGFHLLARLAAVLGAGMGASRVAVDNGWVPPDWQIGLTGKSVAPDLYFAIGISGAAQHLAGINGAKTIVAINTDAEAPIFRKARFGVVGDYRQVVPALVEALQKIDNGLSSREAAARELHDTLGVPPVRGRLRPGQGDQPLHLRSAPLGALRPGPGGISRQPGDPYGTGGVAMAVSGSNAGP